MSVTFPTHQDPIGHPYSSARSVQLPAVSPQPLETYAFTAFLSVPPSEKHVYGCELGCADGMRDGSVEGLSNVTIVGCGLGFDSAVVVGARVGLLVGAGVG